MTRISAGLACITLSVVFAANALGGTGPTSGLFRGEGLDVASLEQAIELERKSPPRLISGDWLRSKPARSSPRALAKSKR